MMMRLKIVEPSGVEKTDSGAARQCCKWRRSVRGVRVVTKMRGSSAGVDGVIVVL